MGVLRVLTVNGDDRVDWDPEVADERFARARDLFESKVAKGWLAYSVEGDGGGTQIRRFDPRANEIIVQPAIAGG